MNIFLARSDAVPAQYSYVPKLSRQLRTQRDPKRHYEVDDPAQADVILFPDCHLLGKDWRLDAITSSTIAMNYMDKVAVYDERDMPWCRLPGIYVSMPVSGFVPRWQVAGSYWGMAALPSRLGANVDVIQPDLLFSFVGSMTHPCRQEVVALRCPRAHVESVDGFMFWNGDSPDFEKRRRHFAEITLRSKFVLCPRGHGTASIRLFEVLSAARVPVIIADSWVPLRGPRWDDFSLRWPRSRISELPGVLEKMESEATEMGARAREAYLHWFAPDVAVARQLDQLERLMVSRGPGRFPKGGRKNIQYLRCTVRAAVTTVRGPEGKTGGD